MHQDAASEGRGSSLVHASCVESAVYVHVLLPLQCAQQSHTRRSAHPRSTQVRRVARTQ